MMEDCVADMDLPCLTTVGTTGASSLSWELLLLDLVPMIPGKILILTLLFRDEIPFRPDRDVDPFCDTCGDIGGCNDSMGGVSLCASTLIELTHAMSSGLFSTWRV